MRRRLKVIAAAIKPNSIVWKPAAKLDIAAPCRANDDFAPVFRCRPDWQPADSRIAQHLQLCSLYRRQAERLVRATLSNVCHNL